jgi:hypothetical protein
MPAADFGTLLERSPFAPAAGPKLNPGDAAAEQGPLEFRGMAVDETGASYSVFDTTQSRGFWIREGGEGPLRVVSYNAQESLLEVEQNGRAVKLQLKRATVQNGAAAIPHPVAAGQPGGQPPAVGQNNPDGRRLEQVAAEVRRRRALRNAATKPGQPGAPAQPAAPASPAAPVAETPAPAPAQ